MSLFFVKMKTVTYLEMLGIIERTMIVGHNIIIETLRNYKNALSCHHVVVFVGV